MQTKAQSFLEVVLNISSGFIVSMLLWVFVVTPIWHIETKMLDNLAITGLFTVAAIIRSYLWRRFFNRR